MILREHQEQAVKLITESFEVLEQDMVFGDVDNSTIILNAPVSFGKTITLLKLAEELITRGEKVVILFPIGSLVDQFIETAKVLKLDFGVVSANHESEYNPEPALQIGMIQTVASRLDKLDFLKDSILLSDEIHTFNSTKSINNIIETLEFSIRIGCTGTPYSAAGFALDSYETISTIEPKELIEKGYWTPLKYYTSRYSEKIDVSELKIQPSGDFTSSDVDTLVLNDKYLDNAIDSMNALCLSDKKTIVFANSIAQAEELNKRLRRYNYQSFVYHSKMKKKEREGVLNAFKSNGNFITKEKEDLFEGKLEEPVKCIVNVRALGVGFDAPDVEYAVFATMTSSLIYLSQWSGRLNRTSEGKEYGHILDLGSNFSRLGLPNSGFTPVIKTEDKALNRANIFKEMEKHSMPLLSSFLPDDISDTEPFEFDRDFYDEEIRKLQEIEDNIFNEQKAKAESRRRAAQEGRELSEEEIESIRLRDMIKVFKSTRDFETMIKAYMYIHVYINGLPISKMGKPYSPTPDFMYDKWKVDLDKYPEKRNHWLKSCRTRLNNCAKQNKKLFSPLYFIEFLRDKYLEELAEKESYSNIAEDLSSIEIPF